MPVKQIQASQRDQARRETMQSRSMRDYPSARRPHHSAAPPPDRGGHLLRLAGGGELSHGKTSCWLEHIPVTASGKTRRLDSRHPYTTTADWGLCCPKSVTRLGSSTAGHCAVEPIRRALPKGWGATDVSETPHGGGYGASGEALGQKGTTGLGPAGWARGSSRPAVRHCDGGWAAAGHNASRRSPESDRTGFDEDAEV